MNMRAGDGTSEADEVPSASGTSINASLAASLAAAATVAWYIILWIPGISRSQLHRVFCERGAVQYATALFFFWGAAMLALKVRCIRREFDAFELTLLSDNDQQLIRQEDALQLIRRMKRLTADEKSLLLTNRIWRALMRFKLLGSADKVDDMLKYQGEMDAADMESSYSFLKFLIAVIPILGFLGTVLGISEAVGGFSSVVSSAGSIEQIKDALSKVTIGLATAFDTTLVALILSAILMFGLTLFQRIEDTLLAKIDSFCMVRLLDHLWVPPVHEYMEQAISRGNVNLARRIGEELRRVAPTDKA